MLRFLLAVVGLVQLIAPERVVRMYTRLAYEGPEAFTVRRWVVLAMRLEGLAMLYVAVRGVAADESATGPGEENVTENETGTAVRRAGRTRASR